MECIEIDIETLMVKEARTANRRLAKKRFQCLNQALPLVLLRGVLLSKFQLG
jgi:hypothetical protein